MSAATGPARAFDAIVIGAGHNALTCATYLARGGMRTLVLERREQVGGTVETSLLAPGLRAPTVAHTVGRISPRVVRDLDLGTAGLRLIQADVRVFAPGPDGRSITLWGDPGRTAAELRSRSVADAEAWPVFDRQVRLLGTFVARLHASTPPDTKSPGLADALSGLLLGRQLRGLGRDGLRTALRALPLPVADFAAEFFEDEALRAIVATRGIQYSAMGPWSAGTTAVLLADSAGNDGGAAGQAVFARGGPGAVTEALASAASLARVEIRSGAEVGRVLSDRGGRVFGVALASGDEIRAPVVVSGVDPKRTLLALLDPATLGPRLSWRASNLRLPGVVAKVNLGLADLPRFAGLDAGEATRRLRGRIVLAPDTAGLERAHAASKYGAVSEVPYLEATIPSLVDPSLVDEDRARPGSHVMSVIAQYAPYRLRDGDWESEREPLGDRVLRTLEGYAPGISSLVTARQILTPLDLERDYGLTGGHPLHGEPSLDQWFAWRPLLGHARYRMPVAGLYLCGAGAHPGGGVTCLPGANAAREILSDWRRRRK